MIRLRPLKAVTLSTILAIAIIGLIAVAEKDPPAIYVFRGASPFNTGPIGTIKLVNILRSRYPNTIAINSLAQLHTIFAGGRCLYIVISPELNYTDKDLGIVLNAFKKCNSVSVLIADEYTTSNRLLEALNSSIRVTGEIILDTVVPVSNPYVYATLHIPKTNRSYVLLLDIASKLNSENPKAEVLGITKNMDAVMMHENADGIRGSIVVIGDGSIFLNQVLESSRDEYRFFIQDLVDYLCAREPSCRIAIDGSRYSVEVLDDVQTLLQSEVGLYMDPISLIIALVLRVLHPSTWLEPLVRYINDVFNTIATNYLASLAISLIMIAVTYRFLRKDFEFVSDNRLEEQKELESYSTGNIREAILRSKIKLTKHDFLNLFTIVNNVIQILYGLDLCNLKLLDATTPHREDLEKYLRDMCRLYRKATGKSILPIVFSWNRTTMKMLHKSEDFLKLVGQSILTEKGVEYLFMTR